MLMMLAGTGKGDSADADDAGQDRADADDAGQHWKSGRRRC